MDYSKLEHFVQNTAPSTKIDIRTKDSYYFADYQFNLLKEQVRKFEKSLGNDYELVMQISNYGQALEMCVSNVSYANPSLIYFYGTIEGKPAQLIQHVSQLNFLLKAIEKSDKSKSANPIGF